MNRIADQPESTVALCVVAPDSTCDGAATGRLASKREARVDVTGSTTAQHPALLWALSLLAVIAAAALFAWQVHVMLH
ncbi:MAG: hypothetical protein BGO98_48045 [Myxococcales bacterium 68-20]|nr:hypothetical protein [Myxococcales bacterium]OJY29598.1 MAG: hypothetical protein BGO98_48045 [Myxococcales bacterium 68-20]